MWKRFFVVILILAAAVIVDLLYDIAIQTAGETFDLRLSVALFWLRPVILVTAYTCILIAGYSLIVTRSANCCWAGSALRNYLPAWKPLPPNAWSI